MGVLIASISIAHSPKDAPSNNKKMAKYIKVNLPPLPGQTNGAVISMALPAIPASNSTNIFPVPLTNLLVSWTTSKSINGLSLSNNLQQSTDLKTWTTLIWIAATGSNVYINIALSKTNKIKFFRLGTNNYQ